MRFFTLERQIKRQDIRLVEDEARLTAARARRELAASRITALIGNYKVKQRERDVNADKSSIRLLEEHRQGVLHSYGDEILASEHLDAITDLPPTSREHSDAQSLTSAQSSPEPTVN